MSTSCAVPGCPTRPPDVWPLCEEHLGNYDRLALARALQGARRGDVALIVLEWSRHPLSLEQEALLATRQAELKRFLESQEAWHGGRPWPDRYW